MPRRAGAPLALGVAVLLSLVLLVLIAAGHGRRLAFTLGVRPLAPVARVQPGHEACQRPIDISTSFSAVRVRVSTFGGPGVPLRVVVRDARSGRPLGRGRNAGGYAHGGFPLVAVGSVPEGARVAVCVRPEGRAVELWGGTALTARGSSASVDGRPLSSDLSIDFMRPHEVSTLSILPQIFRRMALFRPGFVGAWTYWVLLALVALAAPALLALGVLSAEREG
jgi:hypothetical protein